MREFFDQNPSVPQVPWPIEITPKNIEDINQLMANLNLQTAVATVMIGEANDCIQEEWNIRRNLDPMTAARTFFTHTGKDWSAYLKAPHAILNAELIIRTGKPFEAPGADFEAVQREFRSGFFEHLLDKEKQEEIKKERRTAGQIAWFTRELTFAELYRSSTSPLDFIDTVITQESNRLNQQRQKDSDNMHEFVETFHQIIKENPKYKSPDEDNQGEVLGFIDGIGESDTQRRTDAMERGRLRFHQLYQEFNR